MTFRSGFINIIGIPNVGKSTLMNALVGERMSIITHKPQTTRHRIIGIVTTEEYQIVFSDTPGMVNDPAYRLHQSMNKSIRMSYEDADVILFMVTPKIDIASQEKFIRELQKAEVPKLLLLNKVDTVAPKQANALITLYNDLGVFDQYHKISALNGEGVPALLKALILLLPEGPKYYPDEQLTDRSERFFVSEIVREKILLNYREEIPYSTEVIVESFEETTDRKGEITKIRALIFVGRKTQKSIIIGKGGQAIKKMGTDARKDIENFLNARVYLELFVKVKDNWRDDERMLKHMGY